MQAPAPRNRESRCSCPAEKRIVLIGASVRAAAQSADRAGFCVTGIDLFGDRDTQTACHRHFMIPDLGGADGTEGDLGTLRRADLDRIIHACEGVPAVEVGGLCAGYLLSKRLAELCPLLKSAADVRQQLDDAGFLRGLATSAGMRFPRTLDGWPPQNETPRGGRWLIKKHVSCGGLGIRWHCVDQTTAADELLQQWVAGRSHGATMLANGDDVVLLGVCRSLFTRRGRLPFVYAGSFGPIAVSFETASTLRRLGQQIVATTNLRGLFSVDYLLDRRGDAWLLEINPRWSGSSELIERRLIDRHALSAKNSLFELSIQAITGSADSLSGVRELSVGVLSELASKSCERYELGEHADKNATPVSRTMLTSRQDPVSAFEQPVYVKRIMFARSDVRFHQSVVTQLTGIASRHHAVIHDIPGDGTLIRQAEPMLTLISKIEPNEKNPMRKLRVLQRDVHAAVRHRAGN